MGERVCAVVVPRPGAEVDARRRCARSRRTRLAGFKCPEALFLVDELPTTATSKVAKNVLRDQLADADTAVERMW